MAGAALGGLVAECTRSEVDRTPGPISAGAEVSGSGELFTHDGAGSKQRSSHIRDVALLTEPLSDADQEAFVRRLLIVARDRAGPELWRRLNAPDD